MTNTGGSILPESPKKENVHVNLFGTEITIIKDETDPFYGATIIGGYAPKAKPYNVTFKPGEAGDNED